MNIKNQLITSLLLILLLIFLTPAKSEELNIITLNCYWHMSPEEAPGDRGDPPSTPEAYQKKTRNLGILLKKANDSGIPWVIGLQEIGEEKDVKAIGNAFRSETGVNLIPLFKKGRDTFTGQDVAALYNPATGWKLIGRADRHADLEREVSKHLTFTLEKNGNRVHFCVVHLRVPKNREAKAAHKEQVRALLRWAVRFLQTDPTQANVVILGDFNDPGTPGGQEGNIPILLTRNMLADTSVATEGDPATHQKFKRALDRILISQAIVYGKKGIQAKDIRILPQNVPPKELTDHYPVILQVEETP